MSVTILVLSSLKFRSLSAKSLAAPPQLVKMNKLMPKNVLLIFINMIITPY